MLGEYKQEGSERVGPCKRKGQRSPGIRREKGQSGEKGQKRAKGKRVGPAKGSVRAYVQQKGRSVSKQKGRSVHTCKTPVNSALSMDMRKAGMSGTFALGDEVTPLALPFKVHRANLTIVD